MSFNQTPEVQVSIIVPVYNVEQYLVECLDSIYALQDVTYEVILVNDGSPDNSHEIIELYLNRFPDVTKVVNKENGGLSSARNSGFCIASGTYIAFVDSDDCIDASVLATMVYFAAAEKLDVLSANIKTFWGEDEASSNIWKIPSFLSNNVISGKEFLENCFLNGHRRVNCWNKIYDRRFLQKNSLMFIEKLLFEDVPFTFEMFFQASRVSSIDMIYYMYRQRPGSIMNSKQQRSDPSRIIIINFLLKLFDDQEYRGRVFDDYIIYMLWENSCGTNNWNYQLAMMLLKRFKFSLKGFVRLSTILTKMPNLLKN